MKILIKIVILVFIVFSLNGQNTLPIIKANSKLADVRIGDKFIKGQWIISPQINPDVYDVGEIGDTMIFYTDIDSISIVIGKETKFDFIVLLDKTDTAYTQIKYKESNLDKLKKASEYDFSQNRNIPGFTYLDSSNVHLQKIRNYFKLDSVAGNANEISKMLKIMHWVHNIVRHDGSSNNPRLKNAIDLISVCQSENRGINCRMMATILNECYLSMGYKSRMVTCKPKLLEFDDCHVINSVYSSQLNKWIWVDPEFDAYVMNEKGELLGLQEVRDRLINDKPLILNPEANWNGRTSQDINYYLYKFMAKNLYRLNVPIHSTYNYETIEPGKNIEYIELLPLDGINQIPIINESKNDKTKMNYKTYITNNPNQFWK